MTKWWGTSFDCLFVSVGHCVSAREHMVSLAIFSTNTCYLPFTGQCSPRSLDQNSIALHTWKSKQVEKIFAPRCLNAQSVKKKSISLKRLPHSGRTGTNFALGAQDATRHWILVDMQIIKASHIVTFPVMEHYLALQGLDMVERNPTITRKPHRNEAI